MITSVDAQKALDKVLSLYDKNTQIRNIREYIQHD